MNVNATGAVSGKRPGLGAREMVVRHLDVEGAFQVDLRIRCVEENVVALNDRVLRHRNVRAGGELHVGDPDTALKIGVNAVALDQCAAGGEDVDAVLRRSGQVVAEEVIGIRPAIHPDADATGRTWGGFAHRMVRAGDCRIQPDVVGPAAVGEGNPIDRVSGDDVPLDTVSPAAPAREIGVHQDAVKVPADRIADNHVVAAALNRNPVLGRGAEHSVVHHQVVVAAGLDKDAVGIGRNDGAGVDDGILHALEVDAVTARRSRDREIPQCHPRDLTGCGGAEQNTPRGAHEREAFESRPARAKASGGSDGHRGRRS